MRARNSKENRTSPAAQELERLEHNLPEITTQLEALAQELLRMPDNGEGFGFTPREQLATVRKAIAQPNPRSPQKLRKPAALIAACISACAAA